MMPLSNNLQVSPHEPDRFPLQVAFCEDCSLSQLTYTVPREQMFSNYVYRSSINAPYIDHCRNMAYDLKRRYGLNEDSFHIDIAGNDGALLREFKKVVGCRVLNIDPAHNMIPINKEKGILQYATFWGKDAADHLINTHWPQADLITATNVFAHCDDVFEFLTQCKRILSPEGIIILEFPYLMTTIERNEFDQVYFEHLSYFLIAPLDRLCNKVGLQIQDIENIDIHGGSVRVHIGNGLRNPIVSAWIRAEQLEGMHSIEMYKNWANGVQGIIKAFREQVLALRPVAFAASAKGNTLLNVAGITNEHIQYIIDETPEKIHKYSPGTGIAIVTPDILQADDPAYMVVLSWNFMDAIKEKCRAAGFKGRFIHPLTGELSL